MADKASELREKVQNKIVSLISSKMEKGEMTEERAKQIAQLVLQKLPEGISYERLIEVIPTLDDHFEELTIAVVPIMVEYEQKMQAAVDDRIKKLIDAGKLDAVLDVTKKAIEFEKRLA
ncbi:MAG: hypothetical protein ACE5DX_03490 [Candidatus Dojkabacteria bacterium]